MGNEQSVYVGQPYNKPSTSGVPAANGAGVDKRQANGGEKKETDYRKSQNAPRDKSPKKQDVHSKKQADMLKESVFAGDAQPVQDQTPRKVDDHKDFKEVKDHKEHKEQKPQSHKEQKQAQQSDVFVGGVAGPANQQQGIPQSVVVGDAPAPSDPSLPPSTEPKPPAKLTVPAFMNPSPNKQPVYYFDIIPKGKVTKISPTGFDLHPTNKPTDKPKKAEEPKDYAQTKLYPTFRPQLIEKSEKEKDEKKHKEKKGKKDKDTEKHD